MMPRNFTLLLVPVFDRHWPHLLHGVLQLGLLVRALGAEQAGC
jgi:hypothetical protein